MSLFANLLSRYQALAEALPEEEWLNATCRLARQLGFENAMVALARKSKPLNEAYIRSNYASAWRHHYDTHNLAAVDPTVVHCFRSHLPMLWLPNTFVSKPQREMYEESSSHGLRSGITLPIHQVGGTVGMLTLVCDQNPGKNWQHDMQRLLPELSLFRDVVAETIIDYASKGTTERAKPTLLRVVPYLTKREMECLKWASEGKSAGVIAEILNCSEATTRFHLRNIRAKFEVTSMNAAIAQASKLGIINSD